MSPPKWTPSYWEAIYNREAPDPREARFIIENMVRIAGSFVDWLVDDTGITVLLSAGPPDRIGFSANGVAGEVRFEVEDGWVRATARIGGLEVFRGYIERRWEEYEVWPAGATERDAEEPGRLGKHLTWASLRAAAWPGIAAIANAGGWVNIQQDEDAYRARLEREGKR